MTNIQQILNTKKTAGGKNKGLSIPVMVDADTRTFSEYNVFRRINQLDQFYVDKNNCKFYRFYGHINEVVNLKFNFKTQPKVKPDFTYFDLSVPSNWQAYLMAPITTDTGATQNKGDYAYTTTFDGVQKITDLNAGLPSLVIKSAVINNKTRRGILAYLGHNFVNNDLLQLTDTSDPTQNGTYRVAYVLGNKLYLQTVAISIQEIVSGATTTTSAPIVESVKIGTDEIELGITQPQYAALTGRTDVNWLGVITPHIFIKKLVNKTPSEYYLKKLRSIGRINGVTNCAYSRNSYNQKTFTFTQDDKKSFENLKTNLQTPLTDVYIAFVKHTVPTLQMASVRANFHNFISGTPENGGIQVVSTSVNNGANIDIDPVDYLDNNNFLYHSLVEYNSETLVEVEINHIEHTFLCNIHDPDNVIRFGFNPFHSIPIRKFSNNIEEWDVYFGIPNYAVYSEKYQVYRWRHILEIGYFEAQGNGIDFPYMNDAFYVFSNILLNVKNYSSPKIGSLTTGGYLISAYTDTLSQTDTGNTTGNDGLDDSLLDKNKNDKPFEQFNGSVC